MAERHLACGANQAGRTRSGPPGRYVRHRPETTLLYRLVAGHWPALRDELDAADRPLPAFVGREFSAFLTCGILDTARCACAATPAIWSGW
jgi:hypothetical protein